MSEAPESDASGRGLLPRDAALRVFSCLAAAYLLSYALRAINAAIAPELVAEFGLSNAELGSLSSAYFLAFAAMQLPLGVWLDRFGTRRTNATLLLVAAAGSLVFSSATSAGMLWVGRALIGAGLAGALMSSLRVFRFWYAADRQQQLLAMMLVVGSTGALLATAPSRLLLPYVGWRGLFVGTAIGLVLASAFLFLLFAFLVKQLVS
jgi:sugar phosphate permease